MAIVLHNQSILDFAIQHTGSVANAFEIAKANGLAISDNLVPGMELIIPGTSENDTDILNYYTSKVIQPATAITNLIGDGSPEPQLEGIGYWIIGDDNIVS
ncbi:hypothetical protein [Epilithonimonas mollis]|uniref:LysM domain-containing protein n=1 Tax=Epilithonimonas mollis TaxID=216903 RepID=A0A1M6UL22_9FLAO|nr:hypothetical protein [Epilithonimonas mollis]SHK69886.1 hypothetical protein SAMN05444371_3362 [Epilithonimonas mollis]